MHESLGVLITLILGTVLAVILLSVSFITSSQALDSEKRSAYECGFDPFDTMGHPFEIRFYLVAILFLIFDLEISFLFPWSLVLGDLGALGFWSMALFLTILTLGFYVEWNSGALEWALWTQRCHNWTRYVSFLFGGVEESELCFTTALPCSV
jgi:NADH:ubiquinone oxidoreductase subunit 3 (subunit A)